jgi:hypothetical protein
LILARRFNAWDLQTHGRPVAIATDESVRAFVKSVNKKRIEPPIQAPLTRRERLAYFFPALKRRAKIMRPLRGR